MPVASFPNSRRVIMLPSTDTKRNAKTISTAIDARRRPICQREPETCDGPLFAEDLGYSPAAQAGSRLVSFAWTAAGIGANQACAASPPRLSRFLHFEPAMIRFVVRIVALAALAGAFAALVVDGTRSIAANALLLTSFGSTFVALFPKQFALIEPTVEKHIHPLLWDPVLVHVFLLPTWVVLAVFALILMWLARGRPAKIAIRAGHKQRHFQIESTRQSISFVLPHDLIQKSATFRDHALAAGSRIAA